MSFYFREKPRFGEKLRGKSRDELLQELNQQFDDNSKSFFEPAPTRLTRDPFERHTGFSRGFPFDDVEGFGRRSSDIRSHLDDLASRHPEFADHLLGSAWGDIPAFHTGSLRNRRRGSGSNSSSSYQGHPDEDARSQASGSSATSAASGASGVSSQGEPGGLPEQRTSSVSGKQDTSGSRRNPIPQYGLRNTVDIGQHRHNMDNPDKVNRGQRSMSAPPENRQQDDVPLVQESMQQNSQNPNQRFVSRVDITPQFVPQQSSGEKTGTKTEQAQSQQQKPAQQQPQSNVRHIPIFVEGRDEPVIPKNVDTDHTDSSWTYSKPQPTVPPQFQQPPQFQSPPQFYRPSHFNQHYGGRARDWLPNFEEEFYSPRETFHQPGVRRTQQHQQPPTQSPPRHAPQSHFRQPQTDSCNRGQRGPQQEHFAQQAHHPQQHQQAPHSQQYQQPQSQQETPVQQQPRKQTQPKDPLEKVAEVQQEVDALTEQVNLWNGTSRKDKQYMYLDEMLTRELIKLDDIETEGKDNVRQARKNAIRSIQDSISLLESKAPLPGQERVATQEPEQTVESAKEADNAMQDSMVENTETKVGENEQQVPIPLPPAPSSPTKEPTSLLSEKQNAEVSQQSQVEENQTTVEDQRIPQNTPQDSQETVAAPMEESVPVVKVPSVAAMEIQGAPEMDNSQVQQEEQTTEPVAVLPQTTTETSMDVENQPKSPKAAKKVKKTKKIPPQQQTPISDGAIPLPAPEPQQTDTAK